MRSDQKYYNEKLPLFTESVGTPIGSILGFDLSKAGLKAKEFSSATGITNVLCSIAASQATVVETYSLAIDLAANVPSLISEVIIPLDQTVDMAKLRRLRSLLYVPDASIIRNITISFGNTQTAFANKTVPGEQLIDGWNAINATPFDSSGMGNIVNQFIGFVKLTIERQAYTASTLYMDSIWFADVPPGWEECNGQTIFDEDSPLFGKTLDDLNQAKIASTVRPYIKGGLVSGIIDPLPVHTHDRTLSFFSALGSGTNVVTNVTIQPTTEPVEPPNITEVMMIKVK